YVPLARIDQGKPAANDADARDAVYYFHNDVSGLPEELTDAEGELVWQARYKVWGNSVQEEWVARAPQLSVPKWGAVQEATPTSVHVPRPQNLRFQGEYLDRETGLHYNLFRYYDPDTGRFISPDPIGLAGGLNLYQYAPNPNSWIDPWGLCRTSPKINSEHVFHGEINNRGRAVGFHHEGSIGHIGKARVTGITSPANAQGVYRGRVEIFDSSSGAWVAKGPESSFFPKSWNRQQVMSEIRSAFDNGVVSSNGKWEGVSSSGVHIEGWLNRSGDINTAYPIY
ncbi:RHS repeat-associated core domain-containing protein, partial [Burkholderia paludis]|uniref:RHS repeat-associated core domain-containing protein n=1 Tax=Burkholderia paludis TaxID=1506587 RepID=UPI00190F9A02